MEHPYTFEPLGPTLRICVSPRHKFGTDAFLLSHFAAPRRKDLCCDLGTGCGIVALLWYRNREQAPKKSYCVDIQEEAIGQLSITVGENGLGDQVVPVLADLTDLSGFSRLSPGGLDVVTCNPPYKAAGSGILSETDSDRLARHETACSLGDICAAAARLLKFGGRFCLCHRPERLADLFCELRAHGLEPKRMRLVQQRPDTRPWLVLVEAKKGAKPFLQVENPLIVEGETGFSQELLSIYGKM